MKSIEINPIGIIHTPFSGEEGTPIQSNAGEGVQGTVEIFEELTGGLKDLDGFSHIYLITWLHKSTGFSLEVYPYMDDTLRGVFATRAPRRPNPIGIHLVQLKKVGGNVLYVEDLDILNGTPLLDIKPYIPRADVRENVRIGWLKDKIGKMPDSKADTRFTRSR